MPRASMKLPALFLILFLAIHAHAAPKLAGSAGYQFGANNATVTMKCDAVSNNDAENATGTIQVRLWALDAPYKGGTISGVVLGEYKLEGLDGGMRYPDFNKTVKTNLPRTKGTFHLCLTLSEYREKGYVLTDWRNFDKQVTLSPPKLFVMEGPWNWQTNYEAGTVNMKVKKISHTRSTNTGTLRLELWACAKPYTGGTIYGVKMGSVQKQALKAGFVYSDVDNTAKLTRPKAGTYHVVLVLLEYNNDTYSIVSWLNPSTTTVFK